MHIFINVNSIQIINNNFCKNIFFSMSNSFSRGSHVPHCNSRWLKGRVMIGRSQATTSRAIIFDGESILSLKI